MINLGQAKSGNQKVYPQPGVFETEILGFEVGESKSGEPVIIGKFVQVDTDGEHIEQFPASTDVKPGKEYSPFDLTLSKLHHIARACIGREADNLSGENLQEFVANLNKALAGKVYRQKYVGEEKRSSKGNIFIITRIPLERPMAESIDIPKEVSKLVFNPSNPKDLKRLEEPAKIPSPGLNIPKPTKPGIAPF
jgi:hypothetical protein